MHLTSTVKLSGNTSNCNYPLDHRTSAHQKSGNQIPKLADFRSARPRSLHMCQPRTHFLRTLEPHLVDSFTGKCNEATGRGVCGGNQTIAQSQRCGGNQTIAQTNDVKMQPRTQPPWDMRARNWYAGTTRAELLMGDLPQWKTSLPSQLVTRFCSCTSTPCSTFHS